MELVSLVRQKEIGSEPKTTGIRLGSKVDFFELHYLVRPNGGSFTVDFAGESKEISTVAEKEQIKLLKLKAPKSGKWSAKVTTNGDGKSLYTDLLLSVIKQVLYMIHWGLREQEQSYY